VPDAKRLPWKKALRKQAVEGRVHFKWMQSLYGVLVWQFFHDRKVVFIASSYYQFVL